jgi:hypothetical protein
MKNGNQLAIGWYTQHFQTQPSDGCGVRNLGVNLEVVTQQNMRMGSEINF